MKPWPARPRPWAPNWLRPTLCPQPPPDGFDSWLAYYQSVVPEEELGGDPDDYIDRLMDPAGEGPRIWFQPVPEKKTGKTRFHFDIFVADRSAPMERSSRQSTPRWPNWSTSAPPSTIRSGSTPTPCSGTPW